MKDSIDEQVALYRKKLELEEEATKEYRKLFGRDPCCARMAAHWREQYPCTCWQDSWC
jgi:hypothetical protein